MAKWVEVGPEKDYLPNTRKSLRVEGMSVVLFNIEGTFLAVGNSCPHAGLPLGEGELCGKVLTCPFHGYAYNVETGKNVDFPEGEPPMRTFPVEVDDQGVVKIDLAPVEG
ncbi:MAG: Rieske (2Fe-2S) protein [Planctomycetota bacterium]|nr:Rieske (2Fe-2S) protein [Planctomycetota bacterium]